jgi:hypothetical protein
MEEINDPNLVVLGVAVPGESDQKISLFKQDNGLTFDIWKDVAGHYTKFVSAGGRSFPIEIVVDQEGIVRYLSTDYIPGAAIKEAKKLL